MLYCQHCKANPTLDIKDAINKECEYFITLCPFLLEMRDKMDFKIKIVKPSEMVRILEDQGILK